MHTLISSDSSVFMESSVISLVIVMAIYNLNSSYYISLRALVLLFKSISFQLPLFILSIEILFICHILVFLLPSPFKGTK